MLHSLINIIRIPYRALREWRRRAQLRGPRIVRAFARRYPQATFVQIGSNDGRKHDPIHQAVMSASWSGVMVEPVPYVFKRLRENYGSFSRIRLENVAVAVESGFLPFYHVPQADENEQLPSWYDELGSFKKEVVLKHADRIPNLENRLACIEVPCVTFAELCARNGITAVDLIHTDTEGYDYEIIRSLDLDRVRPILMIYEHKHFDEATRKACKNLLQSAEYVSFEEGSDTWCLDMRLRDQPHQKFVDDWNRVVVTSS